MLGDLKATFTIPFYGLIHASKLHLGIRLHTCDCNQKPLCHGRGMNTNELMREALVRKVLFVPGRDFFPDVSGQRFMRLNF